MLSDTNFLKKCIEYDKDNINANIIKKLKKYINSPDFVPEKIEKVCVGKTQILKVNELIDNVSGFKSVQVVVHVGASHVHLLHRRQGS